MLISFANSLDLDQARQNVRPDLDQNCLTLQIVNQLHVTVTEPGRVAQSVTCLATDANLTADPGVGSSIPARSHTFVEIDHEIISTVILLPSTESSMKGCCQLQAKVCLELLVIRLFKLAQEKRWLVELTFPP